MGARWSPRPVPGPGIIGVLLDGLLDALAPRRCAACGRPAPSLCAVCLDLIERIGTPRVTALAGGGTLCAAFWYEPPLRQLIQAAKYRDHRSALHVATVVASERLHRAVEPGDALVPIPLAGRRRRVRGYNQAEVIARSLEGLLAGSPGHRSPGPSRAAPHPSPGTPAAMVEHGLVRTRETASQVGRHRGERALNVDNAFAWRGPSLAGRRVWLVDDVVTTGATAASAARALAATRPSRIGVIALARA